MSNEPHTETTIWEKQEQLRIWHEKEYKQVYSTSVLYIDLDLFSPKEGPSYDALSEEQKEHKEKLAYTLNCMLCSVGEKIGPFVKNRYTEVSQENKKS